MTASISFTDTIGAATLTNGKPGRGGQFTNWVPKTAPYGESAARQSDRAVSMFKFGTDYGASFELAKVPAATVDGVRLVAVANRLIAWLLNGGTCTVTTGDVDSNAYATCGVNPDTPPTFALSDKRNLEYTLTLSLLNLAGSPVDMHCFYVD